MVIPFFIFSQLEELPSESQKGLEYVKIDHVIEKMWYYWRTENLYDGYTKDQVLSCNRIQKMSKAYLLLLKSKIVQKRLISSKYSDMIKSKGGVALTREEYVAVCCDIGLVHVGGGDEEAQMARAKKLYDGSYTKTIKRFLDDAAGAAASNDLVTAKKKKRRTKKSENNDEALFKHFSSEFDVFFWTIWCSGFRVNAAHAT